VNLSRACACITGSPLYTPRSIETRLDQYLPFIHDDSDWSSEIVNRESQINDARRGHVLENSSIQSSSVPISKSGAEVCSLNNGGKCYFISMIMMITHRRLESTDQQPPNWTELYWIRLNWTEYNLSHVHRISVSIWFCLCKKSSNTRTAEIAFPYGYMCLRIGRRAKDYWRTVTRRLE